MNASCHRLLRWAREHGRLLYDAETRQCVGPRDTLWWAMALLHGDGEKDRQLGAALLGEAKSGDGTHTSATMLAVLLLLGDRIGVEVQQRLEGEIRESLTEAMQAEWHDGNVNHPLAAWALFVLITLCTWLAWRTA